MTDISLLVRDLQPEEGFRLVNGLPVTYDDANDNPIKPGYTVKGHITGGYGFALDVNPLTQAESLIILTMRATAINAKMQADLPWVKTLDEPRQRALADMAYNLGNHGEEQFTTFLGLVQQGEYAAAADDLKTTPWYRQVGSRGARLAAIIRNGG